MYSDSIYNNYYNIIQLSREIVKYLKVWFNGMLVIGIVFKEYVKNFYLI